jgi:DNA-binding NarL/FixJ family response regulator
MRDRAELDQNALVRIRGLVRNLQEAKGCAVPLAQLVHLAHDGRLASGVTIDFEASKDLGLPLVVWRVPKPSQPAECLSGLSKRERDVADLIALGLSNKQIARRLGITLATAKDHVHRILAKSRLPNRTAIATALRG